MNHHVAILGLLMAMTMEAGGVFAQEDATPPPADETTDEGTIGDAPPPIVEEPSTPAGVQRVTQRLAETFHVAPEIVTQLREQQMGFGEIDHALTLANQLPGGATQENIDQIMAMRRGQGMGWGRIAHELDTTLGAAKKAPIQEPMPTEPPTEEPPATEPSATGGETGTTTAVTTTDSSAAGAQSLVRPGSPHSDGNTKDKGFLGGLLDRGRGGASLERPGSGVDAGPRSHSRNGGRTTIRGGGGPSRGGGMGGGAGGGAGFGGSTGSGPGKGKSAGARGHTR